MCILEGAQLVSNVESITSRQQWSLGVILQRGNAQSA